MKTSNMKNKKVVVIGIDGLPYSLINTYIQQGVMPNFSQMVQAGNLYRMKSSLPEVSSVAWTSFMTGRNPGEHGIFGFMELNKDYGYRFPNFSDIKSPTVWEKLNIPSVIINIPETYPAVRPLNGLLISGFVAIDLSQAVYPKRIYQNLQDMGYRLDVQAKLAAEDPDAFFTDLFEVFEKRCNAIRYFFETENWQLFIAAITATDRLHHYFYPQTIDQGPYHTRILEFYHKLDSFIGEMFHRAGDENAWFFTCSDHGFTTITSEVNLNRWLIETGYLHLSNGKEGLKGISETSRAFCLDPGRIYIHSKERYPRGCVLDSDYDSLRNQLSEEFSALRFNGDPVVRKIYFNEDIFSGPNSADGPDLYLLPEPGFDLKGAVHRPQVYGRTHFTGMHTYDDAHLFIFPRKRLDDPQIDQLSNIFEDGLERPHGDCGRHK